MGLVEQPPAALTSLKRALVIVNPRAGSVGPNALGRLEPILGDRGVSARIVLPPDSGGDLNETLTVVREASDFDAVIVLGGDGTARAVAERAGRDGPPLVLLPGGTMNLLPHALYGAVPWPEALVRALDEGAVQDLPAASVDGRFFFVAGIFGSPALAAPAREALREGRVLTAFRRAREAWRRAFSRRLRARADTEAIRRIEAVAVLAPLTARTPGLDRIELAYLDPAGALSAFRLGVSALTGGWRSDPATDIRPCETADIYSRGLMPAILDGELCALNPHVRVTVEPRATRVLAPPLEAAR